MAEQYLTPEEAAERLKLHVGTIRRFTRDGVLPGVKLGARQWRISESALQSFMAGGQKPAAPIVDGKPTTEPLPPAVSAKLAKKAATDPNWKNKTTGAKKLGRD